MKIFSENNISPLGKVLSRKDFRLFLDKENPKLQDDKMEFIIKEAEGYLEQEIEMLTLSRYRQYNLTGIRADFQKDFHLRRTMVIALALAEYYERKGRFTEKLCDVIWAMLEESTWTVPAHTAHNIEHPKTDVPDVYRDEMLHGIDLFSATSCASLTTAYIFAKDILDEVSPIIGEKLKYMVLNRSVRPYLQATFGWSGERGNKVNNWCPWILSNILYVTALMEDDDYKRERVVQKAMGHLDNFIDGYKSDGGCDEGPGYWAGAGGSYFDCLELLYDMTGGAIDVFDNELIRNIGEYETKVNIHKNRFVNFADCAGKITPDGYLIARFGRRIKSDSLTSFGIMMQELNKPEVSNAHVYRCLKNLTDKTETPTHTNAVKKTYLDGLKIAILRDSEDTSVGKFFAMKGGHNNESHNHNDVGNFIVYQNGEPVLIDCGVCQYTKQTFSADRYKIWCMQSGYHNLPSFGGVDEHQGVQFASHSEVYDENEGSLKVNLEKAYPEESGLISYVRKGQLDSGVVTISDEIKLTEEKEIDFHFMCCTPPVLNKTGVVILAEGCKLHYDESFVCEIEPFEAVGMHAKGVWGTDVLYRIHIKVKAKELTTKFIIK